MFKYLLPFVLFPLLSNCSGDAGLAPWQEEMIRATDPAANYTNDELALTADFFNAACACIADGGRLGEPEVDKCFDEALQKAGLDPKADMRESVENEERVRLFKRLAAISPLPEKCPYWLNGPE